MYSENRYQVTASLFMLKEMKHRQEQVNRGYQLLKRKAEALRMKGRQVSAELASTQGILAHSLREAYISLAAVKFTNGESNALVLENIGEAQIRVQRISENISGVTTSSLLPIEDSTTGDALQYSGLGAGGHRTGETKKAFRKAIRLLLRYASLRNACVILDDAIKSTLRKVNGIEKVILPKLKNTEIYIHTEMDEREREEFHRLKMMKAKKSKLKAMTQPTSMRVMPPAPPAQRELVHFDRDLSYVDEGSTSYITVMPLIEQLKYPKSHSTSGSESGDHKPSCYPHNWDDEDLLF